MIQTFLERVISLPTACPKGIMDISDPSVKSPMPPISSTPPSRNAIIALFGTGAMVKPSASTISMMGSTEVRDSCIIQNRVIIWSVAVGVGVFLVIALLRILLGIQLRWLLIGFYVLVFGLAMFVSPDFWAVAFDSGGVTTGPMTVPFIMALGVGVSAVRSDKQAGGDSFGLVALCSIGPIITVLLLGLLYQPDGNAYTNTVMPDAKDTVEMFRAYVDALPEYFAETAKALAPIAVFLVLFQLITKRLKRRALLSMAVGLAYVYVGLALFLTGVNVGFMPVGSFLGGSIAGHNYNWLLVPIAMVIGYFIGNQENACCPSPGW